MAHSPHAAQNSPDRRSGYLVAAPVRRSRAPRAFAIGAAAAVVAFGAATAVAAVAGGTATAEPSLRAAPEAESSAASATQSLSSVVGAHTLYLDLPAGAEPLGRVILFPDRGQDAATTLASDDAATLTRAGWAVAAVEGSGSAWGSPDSRTAVADLLTWSATHVAAAPLVVATWGAGAATALPAIATSGAVPSCWVSAEPVTDLVAAATADPSLEGEIVAAWGGVPPTSDLPRAYVGALPTATSYRVLAPAATASTTAREDAATLTDSMAESGHDVTAVDSGSDPIDLISALRGCDA